MGKATEKIEKSAEVVSVESTTVQPEIDSKYRLIIVAAQRSKQLQRGARPRVELDLQRHKPTRVALEEVQRGKVDFTMLPKE